VPFLVYILLSDNPQPQTALFGEDGMIEYSFIICMLCSSLLLLLMLYLCFLLQSLDAWQTYSTGACSKGRIDEVSIHCTGGSNKPGKA
jgi:hypothetical protein